LSFGLALCAIGAVAGCGGDEWLRESNPSGNLLFDPRLATEVHAFWHVSAPQVDAALQLLETRAIVAVSTERAESLIGHVPDVPAGESLYLIRAIDVADPKPLRILEVGAWVQVTAETRSSCFMLRPVTMRRPVVVALPQAPTRLRLTYACGG